MRLLEEWLNSFARPPPSTTHQQSLFSRRRTEIGGIDARKARARKKTSAVEAKCCFYVQCSSTHVKRKPRTHLVDDAVRALPNLLQLLVPLHGGAFPSALSPPRQRQSPHTQARTAFCTNADTHTLFRTRLLWGAATGCGKGMHPASQTRKKAGLVFRWKKCKKRASSSLFCLLSPPTNK